MNDNVTPFPHGKRVTVEVPKEHMNLTINSLLCEKLMGFERTLDSTGNWQWKCVADNGEVITELFNLVDDPQQIMDLLDSVCEMTGYGWGVTRMPGNDKALLKATIMRLEPGEKGPQMRVLGQADGRPAAFVMAITLCGAMGFDVNAHHRELFPASKLVIP